MSQKKLYIPIILLILFNIIPIGCFDENNERFSKKIESAGNRDRLPFAKTGGISIGLYNTNGTIEKTNLFNLTPDEEFEKFISFGNLINKDRQYLLLTLIDYKQSIFYVDNKITKAFKYTMKPNETIEIPIKLPKLTEGLHDVIFIIVKSPNDKSLDETLRASSDMNHLLFIRTNIIVSSTKVSPIAYFQSDTQDNEILEGILVSKEATVLKRWLTEKADENQMLDFYIHLGNKSNDKQKYAIVSFLDWEQTAVNNGKEVMFVSLGKNKKMTIPSKIDKLFEKKIYDYSAIVIYNPFELLYDAYGNRRQLNFDIEPSIRVGIEVQ